MKRNWRTIHVVRPDSADDECNWHPPMCHNYGFLHTLPLMACLCLAGCAKPEGVSYEATALHRRTDGVVVTGSKVGPVMAPVSSMSELEIDGEKATVQVKDIQKQTAVFEVTFPDQSTERVEARRFVPHDIFAKGKELGVEIHVKETRVTP